MAFAVYHTVLNNVSGSIVRYKVDSKPKGSMDGIHPAVNISHKTIYLEPIPAPSIRSAWNIVPAFPAGDDVADQACIPHISLV
jgi:hypothetical protein